jgi:hypothetical protein
MGTVCSFCQKSIDENQADDSAKIPEGLCETCYKRFAAEWAGLTLSEYLNRFDIPVVAVDGNARFLAANTHAQGSLDKKRQELVGQLSGDAMSCLNAREPGGCGKTENCPPCVVRNTIEETARTGKATEKARAWLDREGGRQYFLISTYFEEGAVRLVIEEEEK